MEAPLYRQAITVRYVRLCRPIIVVTEREKKGRLEKLFVMRQDGNDQDDR